jgi:hypothetical protein
MLNTNVSLRFHDDAVLDFCIKRNFTWYSQKGLIDNTTAHDHMQPVFDNTLKNVCIPFGSRIISPMPCEHSLVRGSSFGDRFVEDIYLHAALTGPVIQIFDMHRKQEIVVKDFTSYPSEFPFKDPSCLTHPGYSTVEIERIHQEDLTDEAHITAEITSPVVTLPQSAQMASKQSLIQPPLQPPIVDLSPVLDMLILATLLSQKLSTSKVALWVRFTSPCEYADKTIQMYPKSLEPKKGPACVADFSLLCVISASNPQATTFHDLVIKSSSSAVFASTLLRHFCSM